MSAPGEEQNVAVVRSFAEASSRLDPVGGFTAGWTETTWKLLATFTSGMAGDR